MNCLEIAQWPDIRAEVEAVNPVMANLIDKVSPSNRDKLVLASYSYGDTIYRRGTFYLPVEGGCSVAVEDPKISQEIQQLLSYNKLPIGFVLDKSVETYYETEDRVISDKIIAKGKLFGVWEFLDSLICKDSAQLSNLSAGARSIFMLSKISDNVSHMRLKKEFGITLPPPVHLKQHCDVFADIARKAQPKQPWLCKVLYFSKAWIEKLQSSVGKELLANFFQYTWDESFNCRRQFEDNIYWEKLLKKISEKNFYIQPKVCMHLKQLLLMSEGVFPGMRFSDHRDDEVAPIALLQKAYEDVYRLKNSHALMMHPAHLTKDNSIYYSLNYPSCFDSYFPSRSTPRLMDDLRTIKTALDTMLVEKKLEKSVKFSFYHSHACPSMPELGMVSELVEVDPYVKELAKKNPQLVIPESSQFFKGCIRISHM